MADPKKDKAWHDYTLGEMAEILRDNPGNNELRKMLITGLMEGAGVTEWFWSLFWGNQREENKCFPEFSTYRGDPTVLRGMVQVMQDKITQPPGLGSFGSLFEEEE